MLGTFTLNYAVVVIAMMSLGLLLPDISDELSLSPSQQGWLASSVLIANLIFELPPIGFSLDTDPGGWPASPFFRGRFLSCSTPGPRLSPCS